MISRTFLFLWMFSCRITAGLKSFFKRKPSEPDVTSPRSAAAPVEFDSRATKPPNLDMNNKTATTTTTTTATTTMTPSEVVKDTKGWYLSNVIVSLSNLMLVGKKLHWLPVRQRVDFKLAVLVYKLLHGLTLPYLSDNCHVVIEVRCWHLRSADCSRVCCPSNTVADKKKERILFMRRVLSQSYGTSPATWDHTVLPATQHT